MNQIRRTKIGCYLTNTSISIICNLPPLLFLTFRERYGISFTLLGLLVVINFLTQLTVDMLFSFFSHRVNIPLAVKLTPIVCAFGILVFASSPYLFPNNVYIGFVIGTVIFSVAGGLVEVLLSPIIEALPSDNPEAEISKLHSVYAYGVVAVVIVATILLRLVGPARWQIVTYIFSIPPLLGAIMLSGVTIPSLKTPKRTSGALGMLKNRILWLCILAIFLGSAAENTMAQWCSSYVEEALGIPKLWGDVFGVALFALTLGIGRSVYTKFGKNPEKSLFIGSLGAAVCYLVASLSAIPVIGLIACGLTGLFTSMLWPGSLIIAESRVKNGGVFVFAIMAAGGDLGASLIPEMVGIVADRLSLFSLGQALAEKFGIPAVEFGMKSGLLLSALFPILAAVVYLILMKTKSDSLKKVDSE